MKAAIAIDREKIAAFCRRWKIAELALFGSVLREDFRPDSDVDVLLTFEPGGGITFDNGLEILDELTDIFGRKVDLAEKTGIRNPFRELVTDFFSTKETLTISLFATVSI
jgi:hypothetical protein